MKTQIYAAPAVKGLNFQPLEADIIITHICLIGDQTIALRFEHSFKITVISRDYITSL